jgi:hypothetical protein
MGVVEINGVIVEVGGLCVVEDCEEKARYLIVDPGLTGGIPKGVCRAHTDTIDMYDHRENCPNCKCDFPCSWD